MADTVDLGHYLGPVLADLEHLQRDLAAMAAWLEAHWPADLDAPAWDRVPEPGRIRLALHATTVDTLTRATDALSAGAEPGDLSQGWQAGVVDGLPVLRRQFGDRACVAVWSGRQLWRQAFPAEPDTRAEEAGDR